MSITTKNNLQTEKIIANISPKEMVRAFLVNPPIQAKTIVEKYYIGLYIKTTGIVNSIGVMTDHVTFNFEDKEDVHISANFSQPISNEISILNKGSEISLIGKIFNVGEGIVVLDNCELIAKKHINKFSSQKRVIEKNQKNKWWEQTLIQVIMVMGALAGIIGLIVLFYEN